MTTHSRNVQTISICDHFYEFPTWWFYESFDLNSFHSKYLGIPRILFFFHLSISGSTNFPTFTSCSGNQTLYPLLWQPKVGASLFRWLVLQAVFPVILSKNSSLRVRISPNRALWFLLLNYTLFSFRSEIARISFLLSGSKMKIVNCQQIAGNGANIETD